MAISLGASVCFRGCLLKGVKGVRRVVTSELSFSLKPLQENQMPPQVWS